MCRASVGQCVTHWPQWVQRCSSQVTPLPLWLTTTLQVLMKLHRLVDVLLGPCDVEDEISFLLGRHLGAVDVHDEVVVFHQMIDDRLLAVVSREEQDQLLGQGLAHAGFFLITRGFIAVSFGSGWMGAESRNSPRRISSASRLAISRALW